MPANAVNDITFFNEQNFISASEKTSRSGIFVGVEGVIFYMYSDSQPGIYNIDIKVSSVVNSWFELALQLLPTDTLLSIRGETEET
jgi:hypothetical protein